MKLISYRVLSSSNRYLHTICPLGSSILYASNIAYLLDPTQGETKSFTASNKPVHTIISSSSNSSQPFSFLTAAETDRFVTVFNTEHPAAVGTLRTENPVQSLALCTSNDTPEKLLENGRRQVSPNSGQILLVVNTDGALEIFPSPFTFGDPRAQKDSETVKSRMKQRTRIRAALVKLARPDKTSTPIPLLDASFQGNDIIMAWTEGAVDLMFDRVQWRDEENGMLLLDGVKVIVKEKNSASLGAVVMNGVKDMGRNHIDESRTVVINGDNESAEQMPIEEREVITISSGEEESDFDEDDSEAEDNEEDDRNEEDGRRPAITNTDIQMEEVQNHDEKETNDRQGALIKVEEDAAMEVEEQAPREDEEPTFGDLIRANAPEPVDVRACAESYERTSAPTSERGVDLPSGMSLGAVLTQSLRTNDINLLEICFHEKNLAIIRATIERLDSPLATMLLVKLAERLHSRPGRAGKLMVWIQWTLIAHGGYLTSQPDVMKRLASLYRVVKQRANSLEPLLSLKGKLDMLEAQMNLRKRMQARSRAQNARNEDDDEGVIYVEGQKESGSESERADPNSPRQIMSTDGLQDDGYSSQSEGDNDDEDNLEDKDAEGEMLRNPNGAIPGLSSDSSDSEEEEGFIDDEASSTNQDSGEDEASSDAIDHESLDSGSDASSSREAPPSKRRAKEVFGHGLEASRQ